MGFSLVSGKGVLYVSIIEQCQKVRLIKSNRGDDNSPGLLGSFSQSKLQIGRGGNHLAIKAWHAKDADVVIRQKS